MKPVVVLMGVSGAGKSVVGRRLAALLGCPFQEGDDLHPAANIAKMRAGRPLDDADRAPWLDAVAGWIARRQAGGVVSCSALKRAYRDRLRAAGGNAPRFVLLEPDPATLRARLSARQDHYMPVSLLDSQLAALERPTPDEGALVLLGVGDVEVTCVAIRRWMSATA